MILIGTAGWGIPRAEADALACSLEFDPHIAAAFFTSLHRRWGGPVVCEPRHPSWFTRCADRMLETFRLSRVAADPAATPAAAHPVGCRAVDSPITEYYYRWHGSPRIYWSPYEIAALERLAVELQAFSPEARVSCIFDNTASGSALRNALELRQLLMQLASQLVCSGFSAPAADAL